MPVQYPSTAELQKMRLCLSACGSVCQRRSCVCLCVIISPLETCRIRPRENQFPDRSWTDSSVFGRSLTTDHQFLRRVLTTDFTDRHGFHFIHPRYPRDPWFTSGSPRTTRFHVCLASLKLTSRVTSRLMAFGSNAPGIRLGFSASPAYGSAASSIL
jgi:hypothetical protein